MERSNAKDKNFETPESDVFAPTETGSARDETRSRIVVAAIDLLKSGGRDAVTTRAVAEAAGVQAPTLYRLFGDKNGLLDAVAQHGFASYLREKSVREAGADPVEDLRAGWDLHVAFGLSNPAIYLLMYADPRPGPKSPAAAASHLRLQQHIHRVARAGRLRLGEERAANLFHASGCGTVLTLLGIDEANRDMRLSEIARDAVIAAIATNSPTAEESSHAAAAISLRALLPDMTALSEAERGLLLEWLARLTER